ncbi:hypothetical protein IQ255_24310 [Pleurocapsales cyanobacterium LEGE 10410]|nr:hypothetical protein [Pleurocapsales cyanobacterium LEGE 10410]
MKNQPLIYGLLGLISRVVLTFLIGSIAMSGMMGVRGGMMHDWFRGRCENYYPRQLPEN